MVIKQWEAFDKFQYYRVFITFWTKIEQLINWSSFQNITGYNQQLLQNLLEKDFRIIFDMPESYIKPKNSENYNVLPEHETTCL